MLLPYAKRKIFEQIKSVWVIVVYLVLFLRLVLQMPVMEASVIAVGLAVVVLGLAFFMEGILLGLMPLGEVIGLRLPQKRGLVTILGFALILGIGATFAEPAIGVLKSAGASVMAWRAPLLFLLLNKNASLMVYAVGAGVGVAVMFGMVRFMYGLSLKPFIYVLVGALVILTAICYTDPNLRRITGLAWDCGAVTTGPVTVPLVLALGIGICRVAGKSGSGGRGFGVVTLASLFPVLAVILLGVFLSGRVPQPMEEESFFSEEHRDRTIRLFQGRDEMIVYALRRARPESQALLFENGEQGLLEYLRGLAGNEAERSRVFGPDPEALFRWAAARGTREQRLAVFGSEEASRNGMAGYAARAGGVEPLGLLKRTASVSMQAILPLTAFLLGVLFLLLRERLPRADEVLLGIIFALAGMMLFSTGIELGLGKLGSQVGSKLPALFKSIQVSDQHRTIGDFDPGTVQRAVDEEGGEHRFFYVHRHGDYEPIPFQEDGYDKETGTYTYIPEKGPLWGKGVVGAAVLLLFAFLMGYGATLAEPALNALGYTVEEMTVGTFKKSLLMQAVAIGVGAGISLGVAKIVWGLPMVWLLAPPYLLLMLVTALSKEEFVNIGWDSAGVTTGPVTVPLVLAMGLGIGGQVGVVEGFGILSMASVCPILSVLVVGLVVTRRQRAILEDMTERGSP